MNQDQFGAHSSASPTTNRQSSRLESTAFVILLITTILAPLAFLPTPYIVLDAVKTILISVGTILSALLYGVVVYKEKSVTLPPRSITWTGILIVISLVVSSLLSANISKSFFGQGFELNTASFISAIFLAGLVAFVAVYRKVERATLIYMGIIIPFILLAIIHLVRLFAGPESLSLGVLTGVTTTLVGTWYDLASYAIVISFIALCALIFLPLSRKIKIVYWVILIVGLVSAFIVNSSYVWVVAALVLLGLTIVVTLMRSKPAGTTIASFFKRLAWLPLILLVISALFAWKGEGLAKPVINRFGASYATLTLPWQLTLDVNSGALKSSPLFGVGPNHYSQTYLAYKPIAVNSTYAWNAEFNYAFSLIATFVATQGVVGAIIWALFFIFLGILAVRMLRRIPSDPHARFVIVSSVSVATFLWVIAAISVPSHTLFFYALIATAVGIGAGVHYGVADAYVCSPRSATFGRKVFTLVTLILVVIAAVWGVMYIKDAFALSYFGSGVKSLTSLGDPVRADASFEKAQSINASDIYLQARVEATISEANKLIATVTAETTAADSQVVGEKVTALVGEAATYAGDAIKLDPRNYYNYVSLARVSEFGVNLRMTGAYEQAVTAYTSAIQLNPLNPSLYLSLARLHASQNKLDEALQAVGAAIQVKNNYLEAIYLLSQIEASKGNLRNAIIAAQVATQINPQSPVLFFQLGLLHYNNKDYNAAAVALETAVNLQADYANAKYFLGLSYVRLNRVADAIEQFENLAETNPDNQEVAFILNNLLEGKSPFADAQPPVTPTPEKRSTLPIKEKTSR